MPLEQFQARVRAMLKDPPGDRRREPANRINDKRVR